MCECGLGVSVCKRVCDHLASQKVHEIDCRKNRLYTTSTLISNDYKQNLLDKISNVEKKRPYTPPAMSMVSVVAR